MEIGYFSDVAVGEKVFFFFFVLVKMIEISFQ